MKKITFKNIYLILVISIGLIGLGIGSTYAMFTSTSRIDDPISLLSNLTSSTDIFESFDITINSKENKTIKFNITNSSNITNLNYASWYIYEGNESDITFYTSIDNTNDIEPNGILPSSGGTINIKIINNTSNTINLTIGVITNKDNIVLPEYMKLISSNKEPKITLVDYITNLYTTSSKSTVANNSITYNYATEVNLMNDRLGGTTTSLDGGNIRYYGASPNNYIYFNCEEYPDTNCELWRIIGVFDGKVKIMRNESIGAYAWDSGSAISSSSYENGWPNADLMKLLNYGYESVGINGSLYYNSSSGTCYYYNYNTTSCDFRTTGIKNDTTKNKIAVAKWNIGTISTNVIAVDVAYKEEIDSTIFNSTWNGRIALPSPSDYGYAADFSSCNIQLHNYKNCTSVNWMYSILGTDNWSWLLNNFNSSSEKITTVLNTGSFGGYQYYLTQEAVPTLFLDSTLSLLDNTTGTIDNPYKLNP